MSDNTNIIEIQRNTHKMRSKWTKWQQKYIKIKIKIIQIDIKNTKMKEKSEGDTKKWHKIKRIIRERREVTALTVEQNKMTKLYIID